LSVQPSGGNLGRKVGKKMPILKFSHFWVLVSISRLVLVVKRLPKIKLNQDLFQFWVQNMGAKHKNKK
jgi:hypothetical protein